MGSIVEQYVQEIASMTAGLAAEKEKLQRYEELKRAARPHVVGRIANDNWDARLSNAKYNMLIAACKANIALYTNQIKLRKEAVAKEKNEAKAKKATEQSVKVPAKSEGKTVAKSMKPAVKKPNQKATSATKVKKNADGTVDKRTKEGKAIAERMAKARAAQKKLKAKNTIKKK